MAKRNKKIEVQGMEVSFTSIDNDDFISITDIAKLKNEEAPADIIKNWMRSKNTIELLGLWEKLNNPNFKLVEFDQFRNEAGYNHFVLSPRKWIDTTKAIGLISKSGRNGGTYALQPDCLQRLNPVAIQQMQLLKQDASAKRLKGGDDG